MKNKSFYIILFSFFILITSAPAIVGQSKIAAEKVKHINLKKFKSSDVGNPSLPGSAGVYNGHISITAGGKDIWGKKDEFTFVYLEQTGDFDMVVRIESLTAPNLYTKAGIMARETLTGESRHIYFQVFPDNRPRNKNNGGYEFQYRETTNGDMKAVYPAVAVGDPEFPVNYPNVWLRLKRSGSQFSGYYSADGKTWKLYTNFNLGLPLKVYLGLAVTSHNISEKATGMFKDIGFIN